ncbi:hypothetical protein SAMN05421772_11493 [Paracoccus saliphilus]|uniref:Transposase DDE domain-containing protein n=1 Tax=Paracoccus saliphilus TaxID=405559 RepID=A0AA45W6Z3_9RHOB|nr:hypothetical protein SAMN05421772_11493 [Paracoccus saliphilus]
MSQISAMASNTCVRPRAPIRLRYALSLAKAISMGLRSGARTFVCATTPISGRKCRKQAVKYDKQRYNHHKRIEIMFGRLKDWRRVVTLYDRYPETFCQP